MFFFKKLLLVFVRVGCAIAHQKSHSDLLKHSRIITVGRCVISHPTHTNAWQEIA